MPSAPSISELHIFCWQFYDRKTKQLYLWYNSSSQEPPPSDLTFIATQLTEMIGIHGTIEAPVTNVNITGIGFRDAAATFMRPWGVPSGGDWVSWLPSALISPA